MNTQLLDATVDGSLVEQLAGDKPLRVGKGRAGRLLDGRTHDAFPGGDR